MSRKPRCSIDFEDWPALDRLLWDAARRPAEFLGQPGLAAHWRPKSAQQRVKGYGLWLFRLGTIGALDPNLRPDLRVTEETLMSFVQSLRNRDLSPVTVAARVTDLGQALRVMVPQADLTLVRRVSCQLNKLQVPSGEKALRVIHSRTIWQGALAFLDTIEQAEAINETVRATLYRDALVVAFLAACPIRIANLTMMTLDRHLVRLTDGFGCRFSPEETKEHRALSFSLPPRLVPYLEHYLSWVRPKLLRGAVSDAMWVGLRAKPISAQAIYYAVNKMTERLFGQPLNPHLFRDCAATVIAIETPEHVHMTASMLGHRTPRMSEKHYNQAQMIESSRALQRAVLDLMHEAVG